jgi:hypothetical protein
VTAPAGAPAAAGAPTAPPAPAAPAASYPIRGMYSFNGVDVNAETAAGVNTFGTMADNYPLLDSLAGRGLKAWVNVGWYVNSSCSFTWSDDYVRSVVARIASNPAVWAYYIADEPDVTKCPNAPQQLAERTQLIHSLAPGSQTMIANWHQLSEFAHSADVFALDMYPCSVAWYGGCALHYVSDIAHEADTLGLRYYAVVQAFGDPWGFSLPSPSQLHDVFTAWRSTKMLGYLVFAWDWPSSDSSYWLTKHADVLAQLALENNR